VADVAPVRSGEIVVGLVDAASRVEAVVAELRRVRLDSDLHLDLAAHSAGGLVARDYVR
jgi:alpha-beta hydrolase superfamily lysophospholipase